jgi:hypothetical protein
MRGAPPNAPPKGNEFLEAALVYGPKLGLRVFPLVPGKKTPLIPNWQNEATTDEAKIREWWTKWPNANIGIVTGRYRDGYFCVLDFDPRNGGDWFDDVGEDVLPRTWVVHTGGGGRHYYYKTPYPLRSRKLKNGVDLKGEGGYVVAPPSIHPNGEPYGWEVGAEPGNIPIGGVPEWVLPEARAAEKGPEAWRTPPPIPVGMRHTYLVSLAGALWGAEVAAAHVEAILREVVGLFESTADFDADREIAGIVRDLPKWERGGAPLRAILAGLPLEVRRIVERIVLDTPKEAPKAAGGRGEAKRGKKEDKTNEVVAELAKERWVVWNNRHYIIVEGGLLRADKDNTDELIAYLHDRVGRVSQEVMKIAIRKYLLKNTPPPLEGLVLTKKLMYGKVGGIEGLWGHYGGKIYCYPTEGEWVLVWDGAEAPEGVYFMRGSKGLPIVTEGGIEDLIDYTVETGYRLAIDERLAYAMLIPTLLGQGDAGFVFFGPARSGKSTFARAIAYLERGEEWGFPFGTSVRDHVSALAGRGKITFFDDVDAIPKELQPLLKSKITHAKTEGRELYKDPDPNGELPSLPLGGTVIVCTTGFENKPKTDFLDRFFFIHFEKKGGTRGHDLLEYIRENHERARAGLIALFRKASKIPPPDFVLDEGRFPDWARWAYRYAVVLGVSKQFERYVRHANLEAMRASRFGFFVDFFTSENVKEGHPYRLADIYTQVYGPHPDAEGELARLHGALRGLAARKDIEAIAQAAGFRVRFEKQTTDKGKARQSLVMLFEREPQTTPAEVREAMERRKRELRAEVAALWAEPLPRNGHAPMPEVHTPTPAPENALLALPSSLSEVKKAVQMAHTAPDPAQIATKGSPADVGGGAPMAPPAPREADGHSRTIGITLDLSLLTPEEKERALEGLRKALARLPKPGGILQQKGTPIEGVYPHQAPPELAEYFRAKACALAAEACGVVEKGEFEEWRFEEARHVWGLAAGNLALLIALTPTRECLAAVFLAHANAFAFWAAEDPRLRGAACLIAKEAGAVFFGKAHPDVLLRVLLETPPPTEYDTELASHYRLAVGYLVAAYWLLTGGDPNRLTGWISPARWKRDDAEAILLFSLGRQKMGRALDHLYLGDLPF